MQRVMQDRGVGVAVEGDVGAQAGLQAEIAEGGGASDEGIEEAVAITLQLDAAGLQIVDRNFVAQPRCQQRFALRIGENGVRSEEHTSELQSLMRTSYAVFCLKTKIAYSNDIHTTATGIRREPG